MDKLNDKELNYILDEMPNKLNNFSLFKKHNLFAFGSGNTHFTDASLVIINKKNQSKIFHYKGDPNLISKYKLNYIKKEYIKCQVTLSINRPVLGIMGKEYFFDLSQYYAANYQTNYFWLLADGFADRLAKSYNKNSINLQNHSVSDLPNSLASNISNFLNFLIEKKGKKLTVDDLTEIYELSSIGNPDSHLFTKYLKI